MKTRPWFSTLRIASLALNLLVAIRFTRQRLARPVPKPDAETVSLRYPVPQVITPRRTRKAVRSGVHKPLRGPSVSLDSLKFVAVPDARVWDSLIDLIIEQDRRRKRWLAYLAHARVCSLGPGQRTALDSMWTLWTHSRLYRYTDELNPEAILRLIPEEQ